MIAMMRRDEHRKEQTSQPLPLLVSRQEQQERQDHVQGEAELGVPSNKGAFRTLHAIGAPIDEDRPDTALEPEKPDRQREHHEEGA